MPNIKCPYCSKETREMAPMYVAEGINMERCVTCECGKKFIYNTVTGEVVYKGFE